MLFTSAVIGFARHWQILEMKQDAICRSVSASVHHMHFWMFPFLLMEFWFKIYLCVVNYKIRVSKQVTQHFSYFTCWHTTAGKESVCLMLHGGSFHMPVGLVSFLSRVIMRLMNHSWKFQCCALLPQNIVWYNYIFIHRLFSVAVSTSGSTLLNGRMIIE